MKTMKCFAEICLVLLITVILSINQATGILAGTKNPFLRERSCLVGKIHPEFRPHALFTSQSKSNHSPGLKSGDMAMQRLDYLVNYYWDAAAGQWEPNHKQEYSYNSSGNMVLALYSDTDPLTNQWSARVKECLTWFSKGKISRFISYNWSVTRNQWIADNKQEYFYGQNGVLIGSSHSTWDPLTVQWMAKNKMEYIMDTRGNIDKTLIFKLNASKGLWENERKDEYLYDTNGNMTRWIAYGWSDSPGSWKNVCKDEYFYDEKGNKIQTIYYQWSDVTKWVAVFKDDFVFDQNNNLTRLVSYQRIESSGGWMAVYMEENSYNNSFCFCDLILPFTDDETRQYFCHQLNSITEYDLISLTGKWNLSNKIVFNYSGQMITTGITELMDLEVRVFPNPAADYIIVQCPGLTGGIDFTLFDANGRKLVSKAMVSGTRVPLQGIKSGVYFYQLKTGNRMVNGQLVIR